MDQDLKIIKKKYGENMAKLCREFFPTLLETKGLVPILMLKSFEPSHNLYQDLIDQNIEADFKDYIYSLVDVENDNKINIYKTPKELLSEAGYDLYECKTEEEIQQFRKYYACGEELCTFNGGRLNRCRVFFAVRKDVDEIKRDDYQAPKRQDKYGTSVISIQFMKDSSHTLSIKNRYNHVVNNPDSTFSNNLDNIISGLTESFEREYGLVQQHKNNGFEIAGYVRANDGKYYKYNREINNIYYCPNNIIIDNYEVKRYDKEKYIVMDYFILDLVNKEINTYNANKRSTRDALDSFLDTIDDIEKIEIEKNKLEKLITIKVKNGEDIKIVLNKNNEMIELSNPNVEKIGNDFLFINTALQILSLPNLEEVGDYFLYWNKSLKRVDLPNLKVVGNAFLSVNNSLQVLNLPSLQKVKTGFLCENTSLQKLNLPNLQEVGYEFLCCNEILQDLDLPNLKEVGSYFLNNCKCIKEVNLPNLQKVGSYFLAMNTSLEKLILPKLQEVDDDFLFANKIIKEVDLSNLQKVGARFLYYNNALEELNLPNLKEVGYKFLYNNETIKSLTLPNLKKTGPEFLYINDSLKELSLPELQEVENFFLYLNTTIEELNLPKLKKVGSNFLYYNIALKKINCPNLEVDKVENKFLGHHPLFNEDNFKDINMGKVKQKSI